MNFDLEHHHAYVLDRQQRLRQESVARRLLTTPLDHTNAQHLTARKDGSIMFRLISALRIGLAAAIAAAAVALVPAASAAASDGGSGYIPFVTDFPQSGPVTTTRRWPRPRVTPSTSAGSRWSPAASPSRRSPSCSWHRRCSSPAAPGSPAADPIGQRRRRRHDRPRRRTSDGVRQRRASSPSSEARRAASRRVDAPSLVITAATWCSAVRGETTSRSAISAFVKPSASRLRTSS